MRLTRLFVVAVAMISRRSLWRWISRTERLRIAVGEIALQLGREVGILRHVRGQQVIAEPDLAVGQHDRELRPREAEPALAPLGELVVAGQEFERAIEVAGALERADQMLVFREARRTRLQLERADSAWLCR